MADGPVTIEELRTFLSLPSTAADLKPRLLKRVKRQDLEQFIQDTFERALRAKTLASSRENLPAWVGAISDKVVADFYRKKARRDPTDQMLIDRAEDAAKVPESTVHETVLMTAWLDKQVANDPLDAETLDFIKDHVLNGKPYPEIADERGLPTRVVENRVGYFKTKFAPRHAAYRKRLVLLGLLTLILLAAMAYAIYRLLRPTLPVVPLAPPPTLAPPPRALPTPQPSVFAPAIGPTSSSTADPTKR